MPSSARRATRLRLAPAPIPAAQPLPLEALADHCLAAHAIIDAHGSAVMRRLIDLLLYEVGAAIAEKAEDAEPAVRKNGA